MTMDTTKRWWTFAGGKAEAKGVRRATYHKGSIESAIAAALSHKSDKSKFIYGTAEGFVIKDAPPPFNQAYTEVQPGGKVVTHTPQFGEGAPETSRDLLGRPTFETRTGEPRATRHKKRGNNNDTE
jgi:hypothetical protein